LYNNGECYTEGGRQHEAKSDFLKRRSSLEDEVTEYGHSVYLEHNKMEGFEETKEYAHNILCTLALHVHVVAANLTEHLNLQSIELAKLDVEAKTAESRLKLLRCESSRSGQLFRPTKSSQKYLHSQKIVQLEGDQIPAPARKLPACGQLDFQNYIPPCRRHNQSQK